MNAKCSISGKLLDWYDVHARDLPWRAKQGERADPYRVWLSEVMLQQTTVATVLPRFQAWVARWPDIASLAAADEADVMAAWAGLGYYARARNLARTARVVANNNGGRLPDTESALRALPGLGDYTAAAVAAIAFGRRAVVVDANVERVIARLFAIRDPLPGARKAIRAAADSVFPAARAGDFAQALMDLGSGICTPRSPECLLCPVRDDCAGWASGEPGRFPAKAAKAARPQRFGTIFWLARGGDVLLVRCPARGLLGGMRALPTGPWTDAPPAMADAPAAVDWHVLPETISHGFTHFTLDLALAVGQADAHTAHAEGEWWAADRLTSAGLPTVFAKAVEAIRRLR